MSRAVDHGDPPWAESDLVCQGIPNANMLGSLSLVYCGHTHTHRIYKGTKGEIIDQAGTGLMSTNEEKGKALLCPFLPPSHLRQVLVEVLH